MTIIFDFNRTIYDPDTEALLPGALELLNFLMQKGCVLHLVSRLEPGREAAPGSLGISDFFSSLTFINDKEKPMAEIIEKAKKAGEAVYVIGDHLHGEIRIGNRLGVQTIWLKRGRFAELVPEGVYDRPWRTVEHLKEIQSILP